MKRILLKPMRRSWYNKSIKNTSPFLYRFCRMHTITMYRRLVIDYRRPPKTAICYLKLALKSSSSACSASIEKSKGFGCGWDG